MALPDSSIALACRSVVDFVRQRFRDDGQTIRVMLGSPATAHPAANETDHRVNFFFHRFEPSSFDADVTPGETWWLRAHCLVTAFGVNEHNVSAGDNDLRLLGAVVRYFHEKPVMSAVNDQGESLRIKVVFQTLSLDDINRLWSTQKDVAYRPSLAYEMALVPVVPATRTIPGPRTAALGLEVRGQTAAGLAFSGAVRAPEVEPFTVNTSVEGWAPRICFVVGGQAAQSLSFQVGSGELSAFTPSTLVAGAVGAPVTLEWEVWDAAAGWRAGGATASTTIARASLDPEALPTGDEVSIALPFKDHPGQAVLYARRTYARGADGVQVQVRSNPLLVNLSAEGGAP